MLLIKGVLLPLIGIFLAWASVKLPAWIGTHVKNASVAGVLERLSTLVMTVVTEVEQTVVSNLGDKADAAALLAARDQAIATVKSHLGDKGLQEIETVLGLKDQDAVIKLIISYIESAVYTLKLEPLPTPAVPTPAPAPVTS